MHLSWTLADISPTTIVITLVTLMVAVICRQLLKSSNLPPGPVGLPLIGYWPFVKNQQTHIQFDALKKRYGDIFCFWCTGRLYVHLGTVKAVREAHINKSDCFGKRNNEFSLMMEMFGGGVAFLNSESWKTNRKFFAAAIKERGTKSTQASLSGTSLYDSIASTVEDLRSHRGEEPVDIVQSLSSRCIDTLKYSMFGESGVPEEIVRNINEYFGIMMSCMTGPNFLPTGNIARYFIIPFISGYGDCKNILKKTEDLIFKVIDEHKSSYDEDNIRDIIDDYIKERNFRRSKGDPTAEYFTDRALMATLIQIIGDGSLSVSLFIAMFLKAAVDHPGEQEQIYRELVEVVGVDRNPTIEDKSRLTYTNAFVQEALRTSSEFFPFFPSLECTKETILRGYRIPKGSITLMNFYTAHNDPETYENPEKFDPTRFLAQEGKQRPDLPITFGVGKRACIGEAFTMLQVLLFVTTIVKNFELSTPEWENQSIVEMLTTGKCPIILKPRIEK